MGSPRAQSVSRGRRATSVAQLRGKTGSSNLTQRLFKRNSSLLDQGLPKGGHYSTHTVRASVPREDARRCGMGCVLCCGCECVCVCSCSGARTRSGQGYTRKTSKIRGPAGEAEQAAVLILTS